MIGEALAIPGKGGRGPEKYQVIPPWNIAAALTSSTARKCRSGPLRTTAGPCSHSPVDRCEMLVQP